ncbi:MAG: HAMP domain-containing histidine kinase [Hydrococcus sp. Prado102]|jgi:two-component system NarL family sensor kinase|nr:HAMP domain-containing histidine kinase [Hydrococcus sp. Prado102]
MTKRKKLWLKVRKIFRKQSQKKFKYWFVWAIFVLVIVLEYTTPSEFVFGYLYIGSILLVNTLSGGKATLNVTILAIFFTLSNLFIPTIKLNNTATIANRLIATLALTVTGWLSYRTRYYEEAIARQREQLNSQKKLASLREDFVSTLTHDLKTPILGAIETIKSLQNEHFGKIAPTQAKVLEMMARSHSSSLQLVQTLLDVYRNDTEGLQLQLQPVNLATLTSEVIATTIDLAASRQVYVAMKCADSDFRSHFWVKGDPLQLQRVLSNLIANAINHSPRSSKVEVILETEGEQNIVKVCDRGLGITKEELPHLFERFYQSASNRQATGSGLGLYLSRQIIEAHNGKIWAEDRSPQGAVFGFCLPAVLPIHPV